MFTPFSILLAAAYLAGSVNFPILLFRLAGKKDPRDAFSGNPGVTNVYRQAGPAWAVLILALDLGRAAGIALAAVSFLPASLIPWAGMALILGNHFPVFHGFKGGKGVAAYLGFTLPLAPAFAVAGGLAWGAVFSLTRKPFLGSFALVLVLAAGTVVELGSVAAPGVVMTSLFIVACHHANIRNWLIDK